MKSVKCRRIKYKMKYKASKMHLLRYVFLLFFILVTVFTFNTYYNIFRPQIKKLAEDRAYNICNIAVNEGVGEVLKKHNINYYELITFLKDTEGNVTGIMTNLITVNRLKTELMSLINKKISQINKTKISVPLGNLLGNEFLSGIGPYIDIYIVPSSTTSIEFENEFKEAGINQTRHSIYLNVVNKVSVLMPDKVSHGIKVTSKIPIVENIIVGKVPDNITRLETDRENLRDDVLNLY